MLNMDNSIRGMYYLRVKTGSNLVSQYAYYNTYIKLQDNLAMRIPVLSHSIYISIENVQVLNLKIDAPNYFKCCRNLPRS